MIVDLTGRKAVVTGSTAGIGRATAEGLARAGASWSSTAAARARRPGRAGDAPGVSRSHITGFFADLATAKGAEALAEQAPDADILVNNVGTAFLRHFADIADERLAEPVRSST